MSAFAAVFGGGEDAAPGRGAVNGYVVAECVPICGGSFFGREFGWVFGRVVDVGVVGEVVHQKISSSSRWARASASSRVSWGGGAAARPLGLARPSRCCS